MSVDVATGVRTTYFSALANGMVTPDPDDRVFGVVRHLQDWIADESIIDRNIEAVAPPEDLLDAYKTVSEAASKDDTVDNSRRLAWEQVKFENRYRSHLERNCIQQVLDTLRRRCEDSTVWLVCYEKSDQYCHRRLLADELRSEDDVDYERLGFGGSIKDACEPGQHDLIDNPNAVGRVCRRCNICGQTLDTYLGHSIGSELR